VSAAIDVPLAVEVALEPGEARLVLEPIVRANAHLNGAKVADALAILDDADLLPNAHEPHVSAETIRRQAAEAGLDRACGAELVRLCGACELLAEEAGGRILAEPLARRALRELARQRAEAAT